VTHRARSANRLGVDLFIGDPYDSPMRSRGSKGGLGTMPSPGAEVDPGTTEPHGRSRRRYDPAWNDWNPPRRWPGVLLSCVIVVGFLSAVIWHLRPHSTVHHPAVVFKNPHVKPPFMPLVKDTRAITFSGTSDRNGMHFASNGGLLVLHAKCTCQYDFIVTISNKNLLPISFPVNDSGHVNDVLNVTVPVGPIVLSVRAQGPWYVQLVQPLAATPTIPVPFAYFSSGNDVLGPFSAADRHLGLQFLSLTNGAVLVRLLNEQNIALQTPFQGRIGFSATKTLAPLSGPYFLEIDATGFWNLTVKH
jgi:hypothetical protein